MRGRVGHRRRGRYMRHGFSPCLVAGMSCPPLSSASLLSPSPATCLRPSPRHHGGQDCQAARLRLQRRSAFASQPPGGPARRQGVSPCPRGTRLDEAAAVAHSAAARPPEEAEVVVGSRFRGGRANKSRFENLVVRCFLWRGRARVLNSNESPDFARFLGSCLSP